MGIKILSIGRWIISNKEAFPKIWQATKVYLKAIKDAFKKGVIMGQGSIKYRKGYKYQLYEDYTCHVDIYPSKDIITKYARLLTDGTLWIKNGYAWDGTSGPTLDGKTNMRASLIHDVLYQLFREEWLSLKQREQADMEFKKACLEDGMSRIRANIDYIGLRKFGAFAASPENEKEILTAPCEE